MGTRLKKSIVLVSLAMALPLMGAGLLGDKKKVDKRVEKALDRLGFKYTLTSESSFKLIFDVGEGRSQTVFVDSTTSEYRELEVREVWSPAYKSSSKNIPEKIANKLLEDTSRKKIGAWSKEGSYAVFVSKISADADDESLKSMIKLVLSAADTMEEELTSGKDDY